MRAKIYAEKNIEVHNCGMIYYEKTDVLGYIEKGYGIFHCEGDEAVLEDIAEETGRDRKEVLTDFLCSKTGKALYDEKTRLWCNGPSYIAELYMEELKKAGYEE